MAKFDAKSFNPQAFGAYISRIPQTKLNELVKSRALKGDQEVQNVFSAQTGTAYARIPMKGLIGGEAQNYDGATDITAQSTKTFERGVVVIGRSNAWTEKDFSTDITGGVDFMDNVSQQIAQWWETVLQDDLLAILKGVFAMTGADNLKFVNGHTNDVTAVDTGVVNAVTLNNTIQKASGDHKHKFSLVIMHSAVATNLENLQLLKYLTYTDAQGITRDLTLGTWNGRTVLIDDSMPTADIAEVYTATTDTAVNSAKSYYTKSGATYTKVASPTTANIANYYEKTAEAYTQYTSYVLGDGAISYNKVGAKVPYEMQRDPKTGGGQDTLYTRDRYVLAPFGISYTKTTQASLSPTKSELSNGGNWALVSDEGGGYIEHKAIPIARIISKG